MDSAFALDGFKDYGTDVFVEFGFEIGDVVEFDEFDSRDERSEGKTIFFGGGDADGTECTTMKRVFESEDAVFGIWRVERRIGRAGIEPREFQAAFDGFGAAVGEKDTVHAGDFSEFPGERTLKFVVKEIGKVNGARGFAANHFDDVGMRVAEAVDGDAAEKIEIFFARGIEDVRTAAVCEDERLAFVGGEKESLRIG